jgi:hypothetical protein
MSRGLKAEKPLRAELMWSGVTARQVALTAESRYEFGTTNGGGIMITLFRIFLSTITFLVFFYSTTIVMSIFYPMDTAILPF